MTVREEIEGCEQISGDLGQSREGQEEVMVGMKTCRSYASISTRVMTQRLVMSGRTDRFQLQ